MSARLWKLLLSIALVGCGNDASAPECVAPLLPLQNPRAHTLGETFYLPRLLAGRGCPSGAAYEVVSAPAGSENRVYMAGAPEPRFTPDVPGAYVLAVPGLAGSEVALSVIARSPADRFRNHYLTPLYGAARVGDETWTANGASYTVTRIAATGVKRDEITVGSWPAAIAWQAPMDVALVALRGSDTIGFIDRSRGVLEDALWVGDEPTAVVIAPDARRAWVSLPTMRQVAEIDLERREVTARIELGFDPRALVLDREGHRLFVASYRSGNRLKDTRGSYRPGDDLDIWIIDTENRQVVRAVEGVSSVLRAIALSPDGSELFVAGSDGDPEPSQADPMAKPFSHEVVVVSVDPAAADFGQVRRRADLTRQPGSGGPVVNPAGIAVIDGTVFVTSESSSLVVALEATTLSERWRVPVGDGARQIVATTDGIAVHCVQSRELWRVGSDGAVGAKLTVTDESRPADIALGERVFTRPGGAFAANHSCSSCHVEAQNEGMVWRFGRMQWSNVRPLQLLGATTPLGWDAYISSADSFGYAGPASIVAHPARPDEAEALTRFLTSLIGAPRANGSTRLDGSYSEAALRGEQLFAGEATCAGCHTPPLYTNRKLVPMGKSGVPADVPSLLGVYRHGVYTINGQARTLEDAVDVAIRYTRIEISDDDRSDLVAFVRELTAKGSALIKIWPDIDSAVAVYPDVRPEVTFAEPVDDSDPERSAAEIAAHYVRVDDSSGTPVEGTVEVTGGSIRFTPAAPLAAGGRYTFRVLPGLPFRAGGEVTAEHRSEFTIARAAIGAWPAELQLTVTAPGPMGPAQIPFLLRRREPAAGNLRVEIEPLLFGNQQRQSVWLRLDGDQLVMQSFALPISPAAVADASSISGTVVVSDGVVSSASGTLRITGPGIDLRDVPFTIAPATPN